MKLIIDIPEEDYIRLRDEGMFGNVTTFKRAVREGIPLEQEPCDDEYIKVPKKALKYRTAGMVAYNVEWLKNHFDIERTVICGAQEPCTDAISRQAAIDAFERFIHELGIKDEPYNYGEMALSPQNVPPVTPAEKVGQWIPTQRDKYIDINCSKCGYTRIKEYAYNYTVDEIDIQEIKDLVVTSKMNYCECCGAKMEVEE